MAARLLLTLTAAASSVTAVKQGRLFNPINVVSFPNLECVSNEGIHGECYTAPECAGRGGTHTSTCASGFGVCCYNLLTSCGGTVTHNHTYIRNPGYSDSYSTSGLCSYTLSKLSADGICFIRLDFETMVLEGPTSKTGNDGTCSIDTQTITEGVSRRAIRMPPIFCGIGSGLHLYISAFEGLDVSANLDIDIGASSAAGRKWNIRVTQIECDSPGRPPSTECLQYYTGVSGTLQSWNYDDSTDIHTTGMTYAICLRREKGFCGIQYVQADEPYSFGMDYSFPRGRAGEDNCKATSVNIPGGSSTGLPGTSYERACGGTFGATDADLQTGPSVWLTHRSPYRVFVHDDDTTTDNSVNPKKGFKLDFSQILCTNT